MEKSAVIMVGLITPDGILDCSEKGMLESSMGCSFISEAGSAEVGS